MGDGFMVKFRLMALTVRTMHSIYNCTSGISIGFGIAWQIWQVLCRQPSRVLANHWKAKPISIACRIWSVPLLNAPIPPAVHHHFISLRRSRVDWISLYEALPRSGRTWPTYILGWTHPLTVRYRRNAFSLADFNRKYIVIGSTI
jgi:hypothetical protein